MYFNTSLNNQSSSYHPYLNLYWFRVIQCILWRWNELCLYDIIIWRHVVVSSSVLLIWSTVYINYKTIILYIFDNSSEKMSVSCSISSFDCYQIDILIVNINILGANIVIYSNLNKKEMTGADKLFLSCDRQLLVVGSPLTLWSI